MLAASLILAAAALGVDTGWEPDGQGGYTYIIQIEPQMLDTLRAGTVITSEIPPGLSGVRSFRIVVGQERPPHGDLVAVRRWDDVEQTVFRRPLVPLSPLGAPPAPLIAASPTTASVVPPPALATVETEPVETTVSKPPATDLQAATTDQTAAEPDAPPAESDVSPDATGGGAAPTAPPSQKSPIAAPNRAESGWPGTTLLIVACGLCLSIGANLFLFWVTWDTRRHYRNLVRRSASLT